MTRKGLSEDDLALWRKVTDQTERLDVDDLFTSQINVSVPQKPLLKKAKTVIAAKPTGSIANKPHDLAPSLLGSLQATQLQMDKKSFTKMKRGKIRPEGRLDLHGMTLDRAHPALTRFILSSHASGRRLVLVITGKGKMRDDGGPIPVRHGVLRHQVPQWLKMPTLSSVVLQVTQAHVSHGGHGAYYVYLRRQR